MGAGVTSASTLWYLGTDADLYSLMSYEGLKLLWSTWIWSHFERKMRANDDQRSVRQGTSSANGSSKARSRAPG